MHPGRMLTNLAKPGLLLAPVFQNLVMVKVKTLWFFDWRCLMIIAFFPSNIGQLIRIMMLPAVTSNEVWACHIQGNHCLLPISKKSILIYYYNQCLIEPQDYFSISVRYRMMNVCLHWFSRSSYMQFAPFLKNSCISQTWKFNTVIHLAI